MSDVRFGGNDYLDLGHHPRLIEAAADAANRWGVSTCASRVSVGTIPMHHELEAELAAFLGVDAAAVLTSGYLATLAAFDAVAAETSGRGERAGQYGEIDPAAHACVHAAARAAGFAAAPLRVGAESSGERDLPETVGTGAGTDPHGAPRFVACDGVDGFHGTVNSVDRAARHAGEHGALLVIDDAHGIGVLGDSGGGVCEHFGLPGGGRLVVGSLGKALASTGGFVAGPGELIARVRAGVSYRGSTALSPPALAVALESLRIVQRASARRQRLLANAHRLREGLRQVGAPLVEAPSSLTCDAVFPVVTLDLERADRCLELVSRARERGYVIAHFEYASASSGGRLRVPLSSRHRDEEIDRFVETVSELLPEDVVASR